MSADEVDIGAVGNDATIVAHIEKLTDGFAAVRTVVEGALIDIHAHETVGEGGVEVASELHGVGEGLFAVIEGVLDAVAESVGRAGESFRTEGAADRVATQREGKTGLVAPPLAEIEQFQETVVSVSELAFVND